MTMYKVSELEGALLDLAVAMAAGYKRGWADSFSGGCSGPIWGHLEHASIPTTEWRPSGCWAQGGPIIERERIVTAWLDGKWCALTKEGKAAQSRAYLEGSYVDINNDQLADGEGPTLLIAAMRAYVASKFGKEVDLGA